VARALVDGVGEIAEGARHDEAGEGETEAQPTRERDEEEAAEERVADGVAEVGVEGEGGDRAVDLAGEDVDRLVLAPIDELVQAARALDAELKGDEAEGPARDEGDLEGRGGGEDRDRLRGRRGHGPLRLPGCEARGGAQDVGGGHGDGERRRVSDDTDGETLGLEHERPLLGFAFSGRRRESRIDFGELCGFHCRRAW
jgi:hypothetical protein